MVRDGDIVGGSDGICVWVEGVAGARTGTCAGGENRSRSGEPESESAACSGCEFKIGSGFGSATEVESVSVNGMFGAVGLVFGGAAAFNISMACSLCFASKYIHYRMMCIGFEHAL